MKFSRIVTLLITAVFVFSLAVFAQDNTQTQDQKKTDKKERMMKMKERKSKMGKKGALSGKKGKRNAKQADADTTGAQQ